MIFSGVSVTDETIKLWDSIGSRKSLLKGCLLQFSPDRKRIIPIDGATVEKHDPKPWTKFCNLLREYGSDQCLFGYYDCSLMISNGQGSGLSDRPMNRKIFVVWVPSKSTITDGSSETKCFRLQAEPISKIKLANQNTNGSFSTKKISKLNQELNLVYEKFAIK